MASTSMNVLIAFDLLLVVVIGFCSAPYPRAIRSRRPMLSISCRSR